MLSEHQEHLVPTLETCCSERQRTRRHAVHAALHKGVYESAHIEQEQNALGIRTTYIFQVIGQDMLGARNICF